MQTSAGTRRLVRSVSARSVLPTAGRLCVRSSFPSRPQPENSPRATFSLQGRSMLRPYRQELTFAGFGLCCRAHGYGQRKQIDETFGVLGVVGADGEGGEVRAIKRERRNGFRDVERAFPQFEADGAGNELLGDFEEAVERFTERGKPHAVIDKFGVAICQRLLEVGGLAVHGKALQLLMRLPWTARPPTSSKRWQIATPNLSITACGFPRSANRSTASSKSPSNSLPAPSASNCGKARSTSRNAFRLSRFIARTSPASPWAATTPRTPKVSSICLRCP